MKAECPVSLEAQAREWMEERLEWLVEGGANHYDARGAHHAPLGWGQEVAALYTALYGSDSYQADLDQAVEEMLDASAEYQDLDLFGHAGPGTWERLLRARQKLQRAYCGIPEQPKTHEELLRIYQEHRIDESVWKPTSRARDEAL